MNRRDTAMLAHLDAIEDRLVNLSVHYHSELMDRLDRIREDIAEIKTRLDAHTTETNHE